MKFIVKNIIAISTFGTLTACSSAPKNAMPDGNNRLPINNYPYVAHAYEQDKALESANRQYELAVNAKIRGLEEEIHRLQAYIQELKQPTPVLKDGPPISATPASTIIQVGSAPMVPITIHSPYFADGKMVKAIEVNSDSIIFRVTEEFAKSEFKPALDLKDKLIKAAGEGKSIEIRGRTDSAYASPINKIIARQRANNARIFLLSNGIGADNIRTTYLAAGAFVVDNSTPEGRALNRRVEIEVTAGDDRPLPVVLIRSPYGRAGLAGTLFAAPLARRGFQVFIQSTRGTFGSGGLFRPFTGEREDGLATVAWLRDQPWCDGQVSMTGGSYPGHTQWAVAPYADPPLRSVSLNTTAAKMSAAFYQHGAPNIKNALDWTGLIGRQERGLHAIIPSPRQMARMKRAVRKIPLQAADVDVAGAPVAFWRDFVQHASPGSSGRAPIMTARTRPGFRRPAW